MRILPRNGTQDGDSINGKSTRPSPSSVYPTVLHDRMRLFRALQRQDLKKQNRKALRSLVHMPKHKSCPFGNGSGPFSDRRSFFKS